MTPDLLKSLLSLPRLLDAQVSPDGRWAAWVWMGVGATADVYPAPTDGSQPPLKLSVGDQNTFLASWTPDCRAVLITQDRDGDERDRLFRIDLATPGVMTLLSDPQPNYFLLDGDIGATPMQQRYVLSHHDAMRVIDAIRAELDRNGSGAAVAVADEHGELIALLRTDGGPRPSLHNAIHKAFTAARESAPSGAVGQRAREEGWPLTNFGDPRYTGWGGGVPIVYNGQVVGAVGVSGLPEAEDVELAEMGAKVVGD